jgi:hypothetical protein
MISEALVYTWYMMPEPRRLYFCSKNELMIYLVDNGLVSDLAIHKMYH